MYFDRVLDLVRIGRFLQICKHDVQEEGVDRIGKWSPAVHIVLVVVVHRRVRLSQILRFDARVPAALIFAPEQQIVACDLAPPLPGQGAYLRQLRVVLFSRFAESLQVLINMIVREGQALLKEFGLFVRDEYLMQRTIQAGLAAGEIVFPQGIGKPNACRRLIGGNCLFRKSCCPSHPKAEQRFCPLNQFNGGNLIMLFAHRIVLLLPLSI